MQAASFGGTNIDPTAWEDKKCPGESRFPAQVSCSSLHLLFMPWLPLYLGRNNQSGNSKAILVPTPSLVQLSHHLSSKCADLNQTNHRNNSILVLRTPLYSGWCVGVAFEGPTVTVTHRLECYTLHSSPKTKKNEDDYSMNLGICDYRKQLHRRSSLMPTVRHDRLSSSALHLTYPHHGLPRQWGRSSCSVHYLWTQMCNHPRLCLD